MLKERSDDMRLLAVSHACAVEMNQWLYVHLARLGGLELELLAPTRWRGHLHGEIPFRRLPELTCPVYTLPPTCAGEDVRMHLAIYRGAGRLLRRRRPDLILLDEEPYSLAALQFALLARRAGARLVFYTKQNVSKRLPPPFSVIERVVHRLSCGAVALTSDVAAVRRDRGYQKRIAIVPLAVELGSFYPRPVPDLMSEFGLVPPVIGYLGRLTPIKGVDLLLDAFRQLAAEGLAFTGLIVGGGPEEAALRDQAARYGLGARVRVRPAVPHESVSDVYNCLDIAVLPSRTMPGAREQFGRALIEAMACGVPVVGSTSGAIPEVIDSTGGGLTFPEGDSTALATVLRQLLDDPGRRRRLSETGREGVARRYSYEAVAAALREALLGCADRSRATVAEATT